MARLGVVVAFIVAAALAVSPAAAQVEPGVYQLNPERSLARLAVRGPMGRVRAEIAFLDGALEFTSADTVVDGFAVLDASSVTAEDEGIAERLRGESGFDAEQHPEMRFAVTRGTIAGEAMTLEGELTIKGVTRPVTFEGSVRRAESRRFSAILTTRIARTEFGVTVGRPLYADMARLRVRIVALRRRQR